MDPNHPFNFGTPQWPQAPAVWPQGFNLFLSYSYDMQPQQQLQQPAAQDLMAPQYHDYTPQNVTGSTYVQATPEQLQQQSSCFITPPSDSASSRCSSPAPVLQPQQLQQLQATPTCRPAADSAHSAADSQAPPTLEPQQNAIKRRKRKADDNAYDPTNPADHLFCRVDGRLCVVGGQRTYNVTVAEIERRTRAPEFVPLSLLGPLLKRGKVKGCGNDLKQLLEDKQIISGGGPEIRRRVPVSTLSALLEEESLQLSSDHRELLSHFPTTFLARLIAVQLNPMDLANTARDAATARPLIASFSSLLDEWQCSPSPLSEFALITHQLGVEEGRSIASLFDRFLFTLEQECHALARRRAQCPIDFPEFPPPDMIDDPATSMAQSAKFGEVDGRLTLQSRKYNVSVAEITRRLRAPECLNLSTLGSLLRKGKTSNIGAALKEDLARHGIRVEQGRRKGSKLTCFTSLLEEESLILSADLGTAIIRHFPFQHAAGELNARAAATTAPAIAQRRAALEGVSRLAGHLSSTLAALRLPVSDRIPAVPHPYSYLMKTYSCLTHGYGPEACFLFLECFRKVFDACREMLPITSH